MSGKERDRLKVMAALSEGRLKQGKAAALLGLSTRQVRRILRRYKRQGDAGLVHRSRGRRSNRKTPQPVRRKALACIRRDYRDFGPTLAAEKLAERDGIEVNRETVRQWMMAEGLWRGRPRRHQHRQWRERRECFGELVQLDASPHAWFEGRAEREPVLLTFIDDATGKRMQRFYAAEGTASTMDLVGRWLRKYGRMGAVYGDKAGYLVVNRPAEAEEALAGRQAETQVGRALRELGIAYIPAHSPQAKGRVERSHGVDQDRLIKELRLRGLSTIEEANRFLERQYTPMCNRKFAVSAASSVDAHRRLTGYDLKAILSQQEPRGVANDYTVQYQGQKWQILKQSHGGGLRRSKVTVEHRLDGSITFRWRGRYLKARRIAAKRQAATPPATPPAGRRAAAASGLRPAASAARPPRQVWTPSPDHPWRKPWKRTVLLCGKPDISTLR
jgi:transposase